MQRTHSWNHRHVPELIEHLGITPVGALAVVASAVVMYGVMTVVLRIWGRRLAVSASVVGVALVTLISAIAARSILGESPTLAGGLLAIATLLALEQVFGQLAKAIERRRAMRWARSPVVVMVADRLRGEAMRKHGLTEAQLWSHLRHQGIVHRGDVGLVILEPRGTLSIVRAGTRVDRSILVGVLGVEEIPAAMLADADDQ